MVAEAAARARTAGRKRRTSGTAGMSDQANRKAAATMAAADCSHCGTSCLSASTPPSNAVANRTVNALSSRCGRMQTRRSAAQTPVSASAANTMAAPCHGNATFAMTSDMDAIASVPQAIHGISTFARASACHQ